MEIDTLRCRKIELVDQNGKCTIVLRANDGGGIILLMGETTHMEISISENNGAQIHMTNTFEGKSVPCLTIGAFKDETAGLICRDSKGLARVVAGYDGDIKKSVISYNGKVLKEIRDHYNNPS
jgi:hypothetical protein